MSRSIRDHLLALAEARAGKTFCPSEVARALDDDWRSLMQVVREEGARLVKAGQLVCTQRGQVCDALTARGAIRFSKPTS